MKIKALFGLYLIILSSALLQACCKEELRYDSIDYLEAFNQAADSSLGGPDTLITGPFYIQAYFHPEQVAELISSLVNTSYATSCDEVYLNEINQSTMSLSVNKPLLLMAGDSLKAGFNVLATGLVQTSQWPTTHGAAKFEFNEIFFEITTFKNEEYTFTFSVMTNDGIQLSRELVLIFSL